MTDDELFEAVLARVRTGRPTDQPSEVTVPEPMSGMLLDFRHPEGQMWLWDQGDRHKLDLTFPQWLEA
jgi:hypothetical protein